MGRDWLYWVATRRRRMSAETKEAEEGGAATSNGCMCSVFQLFDLHHFQLQSFHPANTFLQEEVIPPKGAEAPRNSLEQEEETPTIAIKEQEQEQSLNLPVGIQIKTRISTSAQESRTEDPVPEAKTPNLVARLMGLDLLPDCSSPSYSCSDSKPQTKSHSSQRNRSRKYFSDDDISIGAHSLPETPIISSARRSDSEYRSHSVQMNEEFAVSTKMRGRRERRLRQDENLSPGHYAKQIVKQVKESVSRRVGLADITNRAETEETIRRDQNLVLLKPANKALPRLDGENSPDGPSCSPKLRFLDIKKNKTATAVTKSPRTSTSSDSNHQSQEKHQQTMIPQNYQHKNVDTRKGSPSEKKLTTPQILNKKEEPFVKNRANFTDKKKKKNKKATVSSETLNISGPILVPVKKGPSPPPTTLPQKQAQVSSDALSSKRNTQLSSNTSHSYKQPDHKIPTSLPDKTNGCSTISSPEEYKPYIDKILKRAGINDKLTPIALGKWHSPQHPLDPSIYYYLELFQPSSAAACGGLSRRSNRKLIFQVVDEILGEILRTHLDFKPWGSPIGRIDDQFGLIDGICKKIEGYPAANCEVLEDIDGLIEFDLGEWRLDGFLGDQGEGLVCEIEGEILGMLVRETVAMVGFRQGPVMSRGGHVTGCH